MARILGMERVLEEGKVLLCSESHNISVAFGVSHDYFTHTACRKKNKTLILGHQLVNTLKLIFIYLNGTVTKKGGGNREKVEEIGREIGHLLFHSLNGLNCWGWTRPKPGVSSETPMWVQTPKHLGHLPLLLFQEH